MRCFVAIELPREMTDLASEARRVLIREDETWAAEKWVAIENLHVTLAFWSDLGPADVPRVVEALSSSNSGQFDLSAEGFAFVPQRDAATMVWLRLADESGAAARIAHQLRCFEPEMRTITRAHDHRFTPHVTVVRARRPHRVTIKMRDALTGVFAKSGSTTMSVPSVSVFSSTLTSSGPRYELIERVAPRPA